MGIGIVLTVGGVAIGGAVVEKMLAAAGHETLGFVVSIATHVVCGGIVLHAFFKLLHYTATVFGVTL